MKRLLGSSGEKNNASEVKAESHNANVQKMSFIMSKANQGSLNTLFQFKSFI